VPFRFRRRFRLASLRRRFRLARFRRSFRLARFRRGFRIAPGIWLNLGRRRRPLGRIQALAAASQSLIGSHRRSAVVTVVVWGTRLLGTAVMLAFLFLWAAGWL
jgi:hypothetical protein